MGNELITLIIDAKNLASAQLKGLQKDLRGVDDAGAKSNAMIQRGGMLAKGVLAAGIAAVGYEALKYATDSVGAFREEEVGIQRLGASLEANIANWSGNTDAIERNIGAMVRTTGFSDGEMRASLSGLVAATKDVDQAFGLMSTAQDLARFKGISLEEASQALIKVESGQYRMLKTLGIELKAGATQTEALAAVQKVAGGQMAAYMETGAGKSSVLNNRLEDLQETIGGSFAPALVTGTDTALAFFDALDSDVPMTLDQRLKTLGDTANSINPMMWPTNLAQGWGQGLRDDMDRTAMEAARTWDTIGEGASGPMSNATATITAAGPAVYSAVLATMAQVRKGISDGAAGVAQAWRDAMAQKDQADNAADQIIVNRGEISAQKAILRDKKATAAQKAEARIRLRALRADNHALMAEMELLKNKGFVYGRGFTLGFVAGLVKDTDRVGESARILSRVVKKYLQVNSPSEAGPFSEQGGPEGWGQRFGGLYAKGLGSMAGAAAGASAAFAGSVVRPRAMGAAGGVSGAGGGGVTLIVNSAYPPSPQQVREWADVLDAEMSKRRPRYSPYG